MTSLFTKLVAPLKGALGTLIVLQAITIAGLGAQTIYLQDQIADADAAQVQQVLSDPVDISPLEQGIEAARAEAARATVAAERAADAADLSFEAANDIQRLGVRCD